MDEYNSQRLLIAWFRANFPNLAGVFFAIPNGGVRDAITARRLKDSGVLAGVPDLLLAVPRQEKHGLFLEMKTLTGRTTAAQREAHKALEAQGYAVRVAQGYEAAKAEIQGYLA